MTIRDSAVEDNDEFLSVRFLSGENLLSFFELLNLSLVDNPFNLFLQQSFEVFTLLKGQFEDISVQHIFEFVTQDSFQIFLSHGNTFYGSVNGNNTQGTINIVQQSLLSKVIRFLQLSDLFASFLTTDHTFLDDVKDGSLISLTDNFGSFLVLLSNKGSAHGIFLSRSQRIEQRNRVDERSVFCEIDHVHIFDNLSELLSVHDPKVAILQSSNGGCSGTLMKQS
mmetsp:Transcript_34972/g.39670  ORF Transcript_34972/g.39670 Transcript_34972/m.39670 type:complete len:224 (-) Transcript_34972:584-1255(-)